MKIVILLLSATCLVVAGTRIFSPRPAPDRFFTVAKRGETPLKNAPQTAFTAAEAPMALVCGPSYAQRPLRVRIYSVRGSARRLVLQTDEVILPTASTWHAWTLTELRQGNYVLELVIRGRVDRTQAITVTP